MARITVRVTPRASRDDIAGWEGDTLRVRVKAAPTDGNANAAVAALLANALAVRQSSVHIVSGAASRTKIVEVEGRSVPAIRAATKVEPR
jgi:uncharacterized protein (TIGR00251 family)